MVPLTVPVAGIVANFARRYNAVARMHVFVYFPPA